MGIKGYIWVLRGIHWFIGVYRFHRGIYTWYAWEYVII